MKKIYLSFLLSTLIIGTLSAQKKNMKWGKVSSSDLAMTVYAPAPDAEAVVLANLGTALFDYTGSDFELMYSKHTRIKILKRAGFEQGNISFSYYSSEGLEKLLGLRAQIIDKSGKITKVEKSQIFKTDLDGYRTKVSFSFPNLEVGSIIEYKYEILSKIEAIIDPWFFQDEIPTRLSQYIVAHPEKINYITDLRQGDKVQLVEQFNYKTTVVNNNDSWASSFIHGTKAGQYTFDMVKKVYEAREMPALKHHDFLPTMRDYYPRIALQMASTNFGIYRSIYATWNDIGELFYKSSAMGGRIKSHVPKELRDGAKAACAKTKTKWEKVAAIHDYLVSTIQWNGIYSKYSSRDFSFIYTNRMGNSGDLSLIYLALLKEQGIEAFPALIGTRHYGKVNVSQPFINQFNHIMAYVKIDDKVLLIDVLSNKSPFYLPSELSQNNSAWVIYGPSSHSFHKINPTKSTRTISLEAKMVGEKIEGLLQFDFKDYDAVDFRELLAPADEKERAEYIEEFFNDVEDVTITELQFEGLASNQGTLKGNAQFSLEQEADNDIFYLRPFLGIGRNMSPFPEPTRSLPIDFPYPTGETFVLTLEIPVGYTAEVPKMAKITLLDNAGQFQFIPNLKGNTLQIISRTNLNRIYFSQSEYEYLKAFFDKIVEKYAEPIVLKREE